MYGRQVLGQVGTSLSVFATQRGIVPKAGGATIDWAKVAVVNAGADTTWADNFVVTAGWRALRYGQFMCRITSGGTAGYFGPYDPGASDGRQLVNPDDFFFLSHSITEKDWNADNVPLYQGGDVYKLRMLAQDAGGTASLALGPLWSVVRPALPLLRLISDDLANP